MNTSKPSLYRVIPTSFEKKISCPRSKSYANRYLILAALDSRDIIISNIPAATDVLTLIECLEKIGLNIKRNGNEVVVNGSFPACESKDDSDHFVLETGDGGTTNRFLMALLSLGKKSYHLRPSHLLSKRPQQELVEALTKLGAIITPSDLTGWIKVCGPLVKKKSAIIVNGKYSSQFVSALKLATSNMGQEIKSLNLETSRGYELMTDQVIREFGTGEKNFSVPEDWSSLAYPLALAAVWGNLEIEGISSIDSLQGDSKIIECLEMMGVSVELSNNILKITKCEKLNPLFFDCRDCPDLIMTLIFLCANCNEESVLSTLKPLIYKESNRLEQILKILTEFDIPHRYDEKEDKLYLRRGETAPRERILRLPPDHRVVMVGYLFLRVFGGGDINETAAIDKSFPSFLEIMN